MEHMNELTEFLQDSGIYWRRQEPMNAHTSFHIGGSAALFIEPSSKSKLAALLQRLNALTLSPVIMGRGTNLLVRDEGIDAPVICLGPHLSDIWLQEPPQGTLTDGQVVVYAQSGAPLTKLCNFCLEQCLTGLEFAYGIPGTVGGAICMNAGAYGGEMKNVVLAAEHITQDGREELVAADELEFAYRSSYYSSRSCCIVGGYFALAHGDAADIRSLMEETMERRRAKQPLEFPSAGSTFKRPQGSYASALIDQCGLKGRRVGGAEVSTKHAGFIINRGGATARDVRELIAQVQQEVERQTGYRLECEIKFI